MDALSKVIAEETNTFVARCYGVKNSVDMAEIRFLCSKKFIKKSSKKNRQNRVTLLNFGGKIKPGDGYSTACFFLNF